MGKKAAILDNCHSGEFVDYLRNYNRFARPISKLLISDYLFIASCPAENTSVASREFVEGYHLGQLTYGLIKVLKDETQLINLSQTEILCANESYRKNPEDVIARLEEKPRAPLSFDMQRISDTDFYL